MNLDYVPFTPKKEKVSKYVDDNDSEDFEIKTPCRFCDNESKYIVIDQSDLLIIGGILVGIMLFKQ